MSHHPLQSFVPVAADSHFPIQNLPFGIFQPEGKGGPRAGVAIGEMILDLAMLEQRRLLEVPGAGGQAVFHQSTLNAFLALGRPAWRSVRQQVSRLLSADEPTLRDDPSLRREVLAPMQQATMRLPVHIGDYTDFYASREHATNVGTIIRGPENALPPNWLHLPIAYHGRASSIVISGTDIRRPCGQRLPAQGASPEFGPSRFVDYELEMGFVMGVGNRLGEPIPTASAEEHLFGMVLVNDWSARDIQKWEYAPLGPFLSKNFATTISPWIVTLEALAPFRTNGPAQDPPPLEYLRTTGPQAFDVHLEAWLQSPSMPEAAQICASNLRFLYWSAAQQIAHHTINGCNLRTGDLLATGTVSGPGERARACLLERTWGGRQPLELPNGETRTSLQDGDRVSLTAFATGDGFRVGFGEATGRLLPAL